jgi:restriction endonuclease S subunit
LYYLFTHVELPQRGAGQPFISKGDIEAFRVSIPESLEEQRKIVEKLDSAFAEITSLEENLISRAGLLEQLLQGALSVQYKSAIDNTANSMRLGEIADFQGGSQPAKSNFLYKEQKGYVRFIQIRDFGSDKNLTYIPIATKNRLCTKSDILIGRYGASVGKILTGLDGAYNVALMKVIPKNEIVDRDYLYFYLLSEIFQTKLLNVSDRSAQNGFSKDDISGFPVIIPSLREQKEIVAKLAKVRNDILEINLVQLKTKTELALLRKSLLSNALTQEEAVA